MVLCKLFYDSFFMLLLEHPHTVNMIITEKIFIFFKIKPPSSSPYP